MLIILTDKLTVTRAKNQVRQRERRDCVHKTEAHITVNHSRSDNFILVYAMMCLLSHFGALQRAQR